MHDTSAASYGHWRRRAGNAGLRVTLAAILAMTCAAGAQELVQERLGHRVTPEVVPATPARIATLEIAAPFSISVFAEALGSPRMLAAGEDGTIYVTRPKSGDVLALRDANGDGRAESPTTVIENLPRVHGIALQGDRMFLATVDAVYASRRQDGRWTKPEVLFSGLPPGGRHPNRTLGVSPDDHLYISVGSTCNACLEDSPESATMLRSSLDGSGRTIFARGLRNTIGFDWHPETGQLWGMDHGTDWLGDTVPPEELNRLQQDHDYGWPFFYGTGNTPVAIKYPPGFDREQRRNTSTGSVLEYAAHSAPIQMAFHHGRNVPADVSGDAFVAMHGSWNRKPPSGYEVVRIDFDNGAPRRIAPFVTGFLLDGGSAFGRPAGLTVGSDGAIFVGDDANGVLYRIAAKGTDSRPSPSRPPS